MDTNYSNIRENLTLVLPNLIQSEGLLLLHSRRDPADASVQPRRGDLQNRNEVRHLLSVEKQKVSECTKLNTAVCYTW